LKVMKTISLHQGEVHGGKRERFRLGKMQRWLRPD